MFPKRTPPVQGGPSPIPQMAAAKPPVKKKKGKAKPTARVAPAWQGVSQQMMGGKPGPGAA